MGTAGWSPCSHRAHPCHCTVGNSGAHLRSLVSREGLRDSGLSLEAPRPGSRDSSSCSGGMSCAPCWSPAKLVPFAALAPGATVKRGWAMRPGPLGSSQGSRGSNAQRREICSKHLLSEAVHGRLAWPSTAGPWRVPGSLARLKGWLCLFDACLSVLRCHLLGLLGLPSGQRLVSL